MAERLPLNYGGYDMSKFVLTIIAIILPPIAVLINGNGCGAVVLNFFLTLLGYIPGLVHALVLIYNKK